MQVGSSQTSNVPALLPPVEPQKVEGSWWGKYILEAMTWHEAPQPLPNNPKCRRLIEEASAKSVQLIFEDNDSSFLEGGRESIETAIRDVAMQVFTSFATKGTTEELTDDKRIDHFIFTILQMIKTEFATAAPAKQHFKHIANTLLITAYPKKEEDERLPSILRSLISNKWSLTRWAVGKVAGKELSWEKLTELLASQLEEIYTSINRAGQPQATASPDIDELVKGLIKQLDTSAKTGSSLHVNISGISEDSTEFLNAFLTRLLQNNFANPEEAKLLREAREWLLERTKVSLSAILYTIFAPSEGQTQQQRNREFTGEILVGASLALPEVSQKMKEIEGTSMTPEEKALQKSNVMVAACKKVFSEQLHPADLQKLLPSFIKAETVIAQLYGGVAPYLIELIEQLEAIEAKGEAACVALNASTEGESKLTGLVDKILVQVQGSLEKKAVAETLKLTGLKAIDEVLCHLLKPSTTSSESAKNYINSQLKNLIALILKEAIVRKDPQLQDPEKALAEIANDALKAGRAAALQFAAGSSLDEQEFLTNTSRTILEGIISKEFFDSLFPPFLQGNTFWNDTADLLANKVLKGLFEQTKRTQGIKLQVGELQPFLANMQMSILAQLEKQEEIGEAASSLDRLTSNLLRGEGVKELVKDVLPNILESALAYHVNPKDKEGISSEKRAASLTMKLLEVVRKAVEGVDQYEKLHVEQVRKHWLLQHGVTEKVLAAYRAKNAIPAEAPVDMLNYFFHQAAEEMMGVLLPQELLEQIIPKEFAALKIEELLAGFSYNYINEAYSYSRIMRQITKLSDNTTQELVEFVKQLIDKALVSGVSEERERSWMQGVVDKVFSSKERKLLDDFITNVLLGGIGYILKRDVTVESAVGEEDLAPLFLPIAKQAQEVFRSLNESGGNDKIDGNDEAYRALAEDALDKLFPEEKWEKVVPEFARSIFTKKDAANLLAGVYGTLHQTQKVLAKEEESARKSMDKEFQQYIEAKLVRSIKETFIELGQRGEKLNAELPHSLDRLIKQILKGDNEDSAAMRDTLLRRVVFSALNEVMNEQESSVVEKVKGLLASYQNNDNAATAELLFETLFSKELRGTPLVEFVLNEDMRDNIAALVQQVRESRERTLKRGAEAQEYLHSLEGVKPFVDDMLRSVNATLDEMVESKEKLSPEFPDYIDNRMKQLLSDETLNPLAKKAGEQVLYIVLQRVLTPSKGQTVEGRVLEVMENLVGVYNAMDPTATGAAWLKELVPEETLKELLPSFLHKSVTHKKLTQWFLLPYVAQINTQREEIEMENRKTLDKPDENVKNAQAFAREFLLGYTKPTAPENGLAGYSGEVRKIEGGLLGLLGANSNPLIAGMMKSYLDAVVAKAVRSLEDQGKLDQNFLSLALTEALPLLGGETIPEDMPKKDQFVQEAGKKLLEMLFPEGKKDLPVPDMAKNTVYEKARVGLESVLKEVTEAESRVSWTIDRMIPFATEDTAELKTLQKEAEELRKTGESSEELFKSTLLKAAVLQTDLSMKKGGSWWITRLFVRFFVRLFVFFSLRSRVYNFVSNSDNDAKFRAAIWSLLTFKPKESEGDEAIKNGLEGAATKMLKGAAIVPGFLSGRAASSVAGLFLNKNMTDFLKGA